MISKGRVCICMYVCMYVCMYEQYVRIYVCGIRIVSPMLMVKCYLRVKILYKSVCMYVCMYVTMKVCVDT